MPRLRQLSGQELVRIFLSFGFSIQSQSGSHVKLRRLNHGLKETLIIPNHDDLPTGTLRGIFRQASSYIDTDELQDIFYSE